MWAKINRYYPPWLDLIGLLLLSTAFSYIRANYDQIPVTIPTHFGPSGGPNGWSTKSVGSVYGPLLIGLGIYLSMAVTNIFLIIRPENPAKIINIPQRNKDLLGPERLEAIRAVTARGLAALNQALAAMFAYLGYGSTNVALGISPGLGPLMWVLTAVLVAISLYLTVKILLMSSTAGIRG
ncbi:MAG: DUF1648 domain-containing protein [Syntrophomonadaceae bacterium]